MPVTAFEYNPSDPASIIIGAALENLIISKHELTGIDKEICDLTISKLDYYKGVRTSNTDMSFLKVVVCC